jgi:uncharacterized repeat protein (TIGR01451 family)
MSGIAADFVKRTIIVIGGDTAFTEDTSYNPASNDWNLFLHTSGSYLTGNGNSGDIASTDMVFVDTDSTSGNTTISADGFAVNQDATPGTLGSNANGLIIAPANVTGAALFSDLDGSDNAANCTSSIVLASLTSGSPNGGDNTTYIDSLRSSAISDLTITKTAPDQVSAGETFTYTLAVTNSLGISTTGTIITDVLPAGLVFVSASDGGVYAIDLWRWRLRPFLSQPGVPGFAFFVPKSGRPEKISFLNPQVFFSSGGSE